MITLGMTLILTEFPTVENLRNETGTPCGLYCTAGCAVISTRQYIQQQAGSDVRLDHRRNEQ